MELEGSNVFRSGAVERFLDEVEEVANVVGVSVDGSLGHVANLKVFGESLCDLAGAFSIRSHVVDPGVFEKGNSRVLTKAESASPFKRNVRYNRPVWIEEGWHGSHPASARCCTQS